MISLNNRFLLEPYTKEGLKSKVQSGIAMPGQRDGLKALEVLADGYLPNWEKIPAGSIAYIREEVLYTHPWASKFLTIESKSYSGKVMIVDLTHIEAFEIGPIVSKHSLEGFNT